MADQRAEGTWRQYRVVVQYDESFAPSGPQPLIDRSGKTRIPAIGDQCDTSVPLHETLDVRQRPVSRAIVDHDHL